MHLRLIIDKLGSGSDPNLGGAFAEVILQELSRKHAIGIVTTHYLNLKVMAGKTSGIINGAMAFDEKQGSSIGIFHEIFHVDEVTAIGAQLEFQALRVTYMDHQLFENAKFRRRVHRHQQAALHHHLQ